MPDSDVRPTGHGPARPGGGGALHEPAPVGFLTRRRAYPWLVIGTTCLGAFIGQLDASIVQLALPRLGRAFDAPLHVVSWVAVAYSLAFAAALPVFARLAELGGRKTLYMAGFVLFGLFSTLCGLAPDLASLIALRALQGVAGAMLGANSVVILVAAAGPRLRGRAMGIFAGAQAIGVSAGPALGGLVLRGLDWQWIFWMTVPVSVVGALLAWALVPRSAPSGRGGPLDWFGALLLVPALVALLLAITKVTAWGAQSPALIGFAVGAVLLLAGFVWRERHAPSPLIDLALFRAPAFAGGVVTILLSYAMLYGMFLGISFALAYGYGEGPLTAGLRLAIIPIAIGLVAPFSGGLADRWPLATRLAGMALCAAASIGLARLLSGTPESLFWVMAGLALYGVGLGLFIAPSNSLTLAAAPAERSGQAGGMLNLMRAFGTALGVGIASAMLAWRLEVEAGVTRIEQAGGPAVLAAVGELMLLLAVLAAVAALASLPRRGAADPVERPA